ncbi:MAG: hypothetical protein KDB27_35250, partial [Planctomycetales bacterium]|nr:hypothetical protein [Planctomycetales bacterium]
MPEKNRFSSAMHQKGPISLGPRWFGCFLKCWAIGIIHWFGVCGANPILGDWHQGISAVMGQDALRNPRVRNRRP